MRIVQFGPFQCGFACVINSDGVVQFELRRSEDKDHDVTHRSHPAAVTGHCVVCV